MRIWVKLYLQIRTANFTMFWVFFLDELLLLFFMRMYRYPLEVYWLCHISGHSENTVSDFSLRKKIFWKKTRYIFIVNDISVFSKSSGRLLASCLLRVCYIFPRISGTGSYFRYSAGYQLEKTWLYDRLSGTVLLKIVLFKKRWFVPVHSYLGEIDLLQTSVDYLIGIRI